MSATTAGAALLAACGPPTPDQAPTRRPDPTAVGGAAPTAAPAAATKPAAASTQPAEAGAKPAAASTKPAEAGAKPAASTPAAEKPAAAPPKPAGSRVTEGTFADAQILNPVLASDTASGRVVDLLFNGLVAVVPPTGEVKPELAESWSTSDDGLTYTFKLRKGVKFHDGKELTADDVKYTFDTIFDPDVNSPRRATLTSAVEGPGGITVKDPLTIEFTLKAPYAPFLSQVMIRGILPKHLLADKKGKELNSADFNTRSPVGTGPYKFKEWVKDSYVLLDAHKDYFKGAPKIDQFIYKVVKDATVVAAQLRTGEVDYGRTEPATVPELEKVPHLDVKKYDTLGFVFYAYQLDPTKSELFQEKAVRQALVYGLDRKAMVEAILFGQGSVANSTYPLVSWAYDPAGNPTYDYNPARARQMLDDAGWKPGADGTREKNGKKLAFSVYTNAGNKVRESFINILQEQWNEIGVRATPKAEEFNALLNRFNKTRDFDIILIGFNWSADPDQTSMWGTKGYNGGFNNNKYSNPEVDRLLEMGIRETDPAKRKTIYKQIEKIVLDDMPSAILAFQKDIVPVNQRIKGLEPNAFSIPYNVEGWTAS
jgi:peptide/nickel transport system substrate-binding protein